MPDRRLASLLRDIWIGVRSQPGRAGLSFMGIAIGMAALTILLAVLGGLREKSRRMIRELGVNVFVVTQNLGEEEDGRRGPELSPKHVALLEAGLPGHLVAATRLSSVPSSSVKSGLTVVETSPALCRLRGWSLAEGRFLDERDLRNREHSAVATRAAARLMNWRVGDTIVLRTAPFRLVGIVDAGGDVLSAEGADRAVAIGEHVVFVPLTVMQTWRPDDMDVTGADAIYVRAPEPRQMDASVLRAQRLMSQPDLGLTGLSWITPWTLVRQLTRLEELIKLTVGSIAFLCLVLGGTTLMSLMLANVRDRIPEIGLRRTLGAGPRDIGILFLTEACAITLAAAAVGAVAAHGLLFLGRDAFPVPLSLGLGTVVLPILSAVVLGVAFSYWPARLAAGINPADALRNE